MAGSTVAVIAAALPVVSALIALWRETLRNRAAIRRLTRAINRHERTIAPLEHRAPHRLHPFTDD